MSHSPSYLINPSKSIPLSDLPTINTKSSNFLPSPPPLYSSSHYPLKYTTIIRNPILENRITPISQAPAYFLNSQIINSKQQKVSGNQNFYVNDKKSLNESVVTEKTENKSSGCDSVSMRGICSVLGCLLGTLLAVSAILAIIYMSRQFLEEKQQKANITSDQQFTLPEKSQNSEITTTNDVIIDKITTQEVEAEDGTMDDQTISEESNKKERQDTENRTEVTEVKDEIVQETSINEEGVEKKASQDVEKQQQDQIIEQPTSNYVETQPNQPTQESQPQQPLIQPSYPSTLPSISPTVISTDVTDPISSDPSPSITQEQPIQNQSILPSTNVNNTDQTENDDTVVVVAPEIIQPVFQDTIQQDEGQNVDATGVDATKVEDSQLKMSQVADPIAVQPIQIVN